MSNQQFLLIIVEIFISVQISRIRFGKILEKSYPKIIPKGLQHDQWNIKSNIRSKDFNRIWFESSILQCAPHESLVKKMIAWAMEELLKHIRDWQCFTIWMHNS